MISKRQLLKTLPNPLDAHWLRCSQLLGEEAHAQLFEESSQLIRALVEHAFALNENLQLISLEFAVAFIVVAYVDALHV